MEEIINDSFPLQQNLDEAQSEDNQESSGEHENTNNNYSQTQNNHLEDATEVHFQKTQTVNNPELNNTSYGTLQMEQNLGAPEQTPTEDNPESPNSNEENHFYLMRNLGAQQQNILEFYEVVGLTGVTIQMKTRNKEYSQGEPEEIDLTVSDSDHRIPQNVNAVKNRNGQDLHRTSTDLIDLTHDTAQTMEQNPNTVENEEMARPLGLPTTPELMDETDDTLFQRIQHHLIGPTEEMARALELPTIPELMDETDDTLFQRTQQHLIGPAEEMARHLELPTTPEVMDETDDTLFQRTEQHLIGLTEEMARALELPTTLEPMDETDDTLFQRTEQHLIGLTEEMARPLELLSTPELIDEIVNASFQSTQQHLVGLTEEMVSPLELLTTPELIGETDDTSIQRTQQHLIDPTEEMARPLELPTTPELMDKTDDTLFQRTQQHLIGPRETYEHFIYIIRNLEAENISRVVEYRRKLAENNPECFDHQTEIMEVYSEDMRHYNPNEIIDDLQQVREHYSNIRNQYYRERIQRILHEITEDWNENKPALEEIHKNFTEENIIYFKRAMMIVPQINASPHWMEGYLRAYYAFASMYHELVYKQLMHCALQHGLTLASIYTVEELDNQINHDLMGRLRERSRNPLRYDGSTMELAEAIRMQFTLTQDLYKKLEEVMIMQNIFQNRSNQNVDATMNTNLPAQQDVNAVISVSPVGTNPNERLDQYQPSTINYDSAAMPDANSGETSDIPVSHLGGNPLTEGEPETEPNIITTVIPLGPDSERPPIMVLEHTEGAKPACIKIERDGTRRSITLSELRKIIRNSLLHSIRLAPDNTSATVDLQITVSSSASTSMTAGPSISSMIAGPSSAGPCTSAGPSSIAG